MMWGYGLGTCGSAQGSVATLVNIMELRVAYKAEQLFVSRDGLCHIVYIVFYILSSC
jgi:hypothetical protein